MTPVYQQPQLKEDKASKPTNFDAGRSLEKSTYLKDNRQKPTIPFKRTIATNGENAPIQGNFYLKGPHNTTTWHAEAPDTRMYEDTGERQNATFFSYPIYKNKLLDSRSYPKSSEDETMDIAKDTGLVPQEFRGELQTVESVITALSPQQQQQFNTAYNSLDSYCRDKDKTKIVEGALTNVRAGALFDAGQAHPNDANAKAIFIKRFVLMTNYIKSVGDKVIGKGPDHVKNKFWIQSTGSDPHAGGNHALFLINKVNPQKKQLYKAHSLKFENAFIGTNGIISEANKHLKKNERLATMNINPKEHSEEFVGRVGDQNDPNYTVAMLGDHTEKLGQLETISHVFGVTDLHAENVLFGESGPVPIDSEVGGGYPGITGIDDQFGPGRVNDNQMKTPSSLYVGGEQQDMDQERFNAGKQKMALRIRQYRKSLLKHWRKQLRAVDTFRVIPIPTSQLAGALKMSLNPASQVHVEGQFTQEMNNFIQTNDMAVHLQMKIVKRGARRFWNILQEGTLPAFEFSMKTGQLLMDGKTVAYPQVKDVTKEMNVLKLSELAGERINEL